MATEGQDTSISSADMFEQVFEPDQPQAPAPEQPADPPVQAQEPSGERPRDEKGRFAPKAEDEQPPAQAQEPPPVQPQPPQADHRVPLSELLNTRERAQNAERERDEFRRTVENLQRQMAQRDQPKPEPPPDVLENPQGFVGHLEQTFNQRLRVQEVNFSLRLAHKEYKGEFESAYTAALNARQNGDPAITAVLNSPDPGEALMRWHRSNTLLEKTGGNLDAYLEAQLQEKLKDPAFLAKAMEAARGQAQQPNSQQAPVVELPPSLTRTPGSSAASTANGGMPSGQELFDLATAR